MYKILGTDNKEYGPAPAERVRQWIGERRVQARSLARAEGTTGWKAISLFPEFSDALAAVAWHGGTAGGRHDVPAGPSRVNSNALASLICGCVGLSCCQLVSIAGLICGVIALSQLKDNPEKEGRGMAIAGIVLSAVGLLAVLGTGLLLVIFSLAGALG